MSLSEKTRLRLQSLRRIVFGLVWFVSLWFNGLLFGATIAGYWQPLQGSPPRNFSESVNRTRVTGRAAAEKFDRKYGREVLLGAIAISGLGTLFGVLPGTRPKD